MTASPQPTRDTYSFCLFDGGKGPVGKHLQPTDSVFQEQGNGSLFLEFGRRNSSTLATHHRRRPVYRYPFVTHSYTPTSSSRPTNILMSDGCIRTPTTSAQPSSTASIHLRSIATSSNSIEEGNLTTPIPVEWSTPKDFTVWVSGGSPLRPKGEWVGICSAVCLPACKPFFVASSLEGGCGGW